MRSIGVALHAERHVEPLWVFTAITRHSLLCWNITDCGGSSRPQVLPPHCAIRGFLAVTNLGSQCTRLCLAARSCYKAMDL